MSSKNRLFLAIAAALFGLAAIRPRPALACSIYFCVNQYCGTSNGVLCCDSGDTACAAAIQKCRDTTSCPWT
jgi:hypothetical protein